MRMVVATLAASWLALGASLAVAQSPAPAAAASKPPAAAVSKPAKPRQAASARTAAPPPAIPAAIEEAAPVAEPKILCDDRGCRSYPANCHIESDFTVNGQYDSVRCD